MFWSNINSRFKSDPVAIAREFAITPGHGLFSVTDRNGALPPTLKQHSYSDGTEYLSLPGDRRVLYIDLVREESGLTVKYSPVARKDWIPVYFLPWAAGRVVKTTLVDKRDDAPDVPRIFLTAAVNGCSVFVEGDPQTPSVYHANALGYDPNNRGGSATPSKALRRERMDIMQQRLTAIPSPKRGNQGNTRGVEGRHYMGDFTRTTTALEKQGFEDKLKDKIGKKTVIGHGTATSAREGVGQVSIDPSYVYEGTVFGVRDKRTGWSFWYQKRVSMDVYTLKKGADPALRASWEASSHWISSNVEQFWPAGGGVAVARTSPLAAWPG